MIYYFEIFISLNILFFPFKMSFHLYDVPDTFINQNAITNKVVVLDLDATLLSTADDMASFKELGIMTDPKLVTLRRRCYCLKLTDFDKRGDGSTYSFWGIKRPHIDTFLLWCMNYFSLVIVWSAGTFHYVHAIVNDIFRDLRPPALVWTANDIDYDTDEEVLKPLTKLMNSDFKYKHLITKQNTVFIDDNDSTFRFNKKNAVHIKPFNEEFNIESMKKNDNTLLQLMHFFMLPHVIHADDITKVDLTRIFDYDYKDYQNIANTYGKD